MYKNTNKIPPVQPEYNKDLLTNRKLQEIPDFLWVSLTSYSGLFIFEKFLLSKNSYPSVNCSSTVPPTNNHLSRRDSSYVLQESSFIPFLEPYQPKFTFTLRQAN